MDEIVEASDDPHNVRQESTTSNRPAHKSNELVSGILDFFSTASNETLGACIAGLGAATYLLLGRVGLLLIGITIGVALHAGWEQQGELPGSGGGVEYRGKRKETTLEIVQRLLQSQDQRHQDIWRDAKAGHDVPAQLSGGHELHLDDFQPATAGALNRLITAAVNDYVKWWYSPLLPHDDSFPFACRQILTNFILSLSSHISRKRPTDTFLTFLTNCTSIMVVFLSELSVALKAPGVDTASSMDAVSQYLENHKESNLANVLDQKEQGRKLRVVADDVLKTFLDAKAYHCNPMRVFLKEVLAGLILEPMLQSCSKADWINGWIVYLLEEGEPDIMSAISTGVSETASAELSKRVAVDGQHKNLQTSSCEPNTQKQSPHDEREVYLTDDATKMAMLEAKRLSEMIAAEEASRDQTVNEHVSSTTSTRAPPTPTSSQSDLPGTDSNLLPDKYVAAAPGELASTRMGSSKPLGEDFVATTAFTNFDQLDIPIRPASQASHAGPLSLLNAKIVIFDDSQPGERGNVRSKPATEYLLQVEPAPPHHPGWMIARKYADFEMLHEVLRRISVVSGVPKFAQKYTSLPTWKNKSKDALCLDLESYLSEALCQISLAECEGMKRFLEKDQAISKLSDPKVNLGFPSPETFQTVGKGMLDVLVNAPKGAAGGGKALFEGVSGVFQKKSTNADAIRSSKPATAVDEVIGLTQRRSTSSRSNTEKHTDDDTEVLQFSPGRRPRHVEENRESSTSVSTDPERATTFLSRPSGDAFDRRNALGSHDETRSFAHSEQPFPEQDSLEAQPAGRSNRDDIQISLPPPPSEISEGYEPSKLRRHSSPADSWLSEHKQGDATLSGTLSSIQTHISEIESMTARNKGLPFPKKATSPMTIEETQIAVELLFAMISELYTLSSVWNIRRTLLNAAKAFLMRPGNPSLEAIRALLQERVIDANVSDEGMAAHVDKLRENTMPTEEEQARWPSPLSTAESTTLRQKARKLLIEQGIPPALKGIMGSNASTEALAKVFDSLQMESVSRGLIFALMVQCIRTMIH